jgi:hypothetical protein
MSWQRKIPFGYRIRNGKPVPHPDEAHAVRRIFDRYLKGGGYFAIAEVMTESGIRYHAATPEWNKNMIKRILENAKYTGGNDWPEIVPADIFKQAESIRGFKTQGWHKHPVCNDAVKRKLVCGVCGAPFRVQTQTSSRDGVRWWRCGNGECGGMLKMTDTELERRVTALLNRLVSRPKWLDIQPTAAPLSLEAEWTQNEFYRELSKMDWHEDYAKSLALACAAERYDALGNRDCLTGKAAALQARLSGMAPLTAFDSGLFAATANALIVDAGGALALGLISGAIISENETAEVEHHADTVS